MDVELWLFDCEERPLTRHGLHDDRKDLGNPEADVSHPYGCLRGALTQPGHENVAEHLARRLQRVDSELVRHAQSPEPHIDGGTERLGPSEKSDRVLTGNTDIGKLLAGKKYQPFGWLPKGSKVDDPRRHLARDTIRSGNRLNKDLLNESTLWVLLARNRLAVKVVRRKAQTSAGLNPVITT
jgi:hypothetical protein